MTSRIYSYLDRNRVGEFLLLDDEDLSFTTSADCDFNRKIVGTLPAMSGDFAYEGYFWSTSRDPLVDLTSFGITTDDSANLATYTGGDLRSYGLVCANGEIHNNGGAIAALSATIDERIPVGLHLHLEPSLAYVEWLRSGSVIATTSLPVGKAWYPSFSIGSSAPGDVSGKFNFGQWRMDRARQWRNGWSQQTAGFNVIRIAMVQEAFHTLPTDTPASTPYGPFMVGADKVLVKKGPRPWHLRDSDGDGSTSLSVLVLDNSTGEFNSLLSADVRDSTLVLQRVRSPGGVAGSLAAAVTILTGVVESISLARGLIQVVLRGTLARLDRPMKMRRIPPFYDAASAGSVVPFGRGAQRNVRPKLLSEPDRLFLLADAPQTNITLASDSGAPLDPNALPPQYTPALDHEGIQFEVMPEGRIGVDCSSVGEQYDIPGASDVLASIGDFATWAVTANTQTSTPPSGWTFSNNASAWIMRIAAGGGKNVLRLKTIVPWYPEHPTTPKYGDWIKVTTPPLLAGRSYRLKIGILTAQSDPPLVGSSHRTGGLMLRTDLSNDPLDAVSAHGVAISTNGQGSNGFGYFQTFDFTVPTGGGSKSLYIIGTASSGSTAGSATGIGLIEVHEVSIELLGQFQSLPLADILPKDAVHDILVEIEGEDPGIYSATDLDALATETGQATHGVSLRYEDTPNVRDVLQDIVDQYGAIMFEDEFGVIRFKRWRMPDSPLAPPPVARFTYANVNVDTLAIDPVAADGFTTQFWSRPNCEPFADGDFVSDTTLVTAAIRNAYTGEGQYQFSSTLAPAQEYLKRSGNGRRMIRVDNLAAARHETDNVCGQMQVKRMAVTFDALYDGGGDSIGDGIAVAPQQLYPGDVVILHLPDHGFDEKAVTVGDTALYDADGKLQIKGVY
ncbi:hypothetical protein FHW12_000358 [Dokdonella fugitiva]|uniref:Tail protein n=1 Tax=Dokdonella fugitiva TaxID=328517 RepID=A0A839EPD9_9GAMM|nr:hypothetical protein [Dokdonella fugitiva]MBA8886167.1 hypothetical protein [Dokdonella fugitiva]